MTKTDKQFIKNTIRYLLIYYSKAKVGETPSQYQLWLIEKYSDALEVFGLDQIKHAIDQHLAKSHYWPLISDLVQSIKKRDKKAKSCQFGVCDGSGYLDVGVIDAGTPKFDKDGNLDTTFSRVCACVIGETKFNDYNGTKFVYPIDDRQKNCYSDTHREV